MIDSMTATDERICGAMNECESCPNADDRKVAGLLDLKLSGYDRDNMPPLYLSGPMSGIPHFNFPAFNEVARQLRLLGFPILNPADFGADEAYTWEQCIARDCLFLSYARAVVLLPGWEESKGSNAELDHALNIGIPVVTLECLLDKVILRFLQPEEVAGIIKLDVFREDFGVGIFEATGEIIVARKEKLELAVAIADRIARNVKNTRPAWEDDEDDDDQDDD